MNNILIEIQDYILTNYIIAPKSTYTYKLVYKINVNNLSFITIFIYNTDNSIGITDYLDEKNSISNIPRNSLSFKDIDIDDAKAHLSKILESANAHL